MSTLSEHLNLFMYDTVEDGKQVFSIDTALNDNWVKLDTKIYELDKQINNSQKAKYLEIDKNVLIVKANTIIAFNNYEFEWTEDESFIITDLLEDDEILAGKDYCVFITNEGNLIISQNNTYPTDYNEETCYKIGGFHTLCVSVTSTNAPTLASNSFWDTHPAIDYNAGDAIPNSVWTNNFRPVCDPSGMVYISEGYGEPGFWVDIYLQSGNYSTTQSAYGATLTNSRMPILHAYDMLLQNKKLARDNQFLIFAEGSNQKTAIYGSALPSPTTTGGHLDTSSKRMISGFFVEECCGYVWQWLDELGPAGSSGWTSYTDTARGSNYGNTYVLRAGGHYDDSTCCGSWSRNSHATRLLVSTNLGARGVSYHYTTE